MFEDIKDPERNSIKWDFWKSFPVFADEARKDVVWMCVILFVYFGAHLSSWRTLAAGLIAAYALALFLSALLAVTRNQVIAVVLAADSAVIAWMVGVPRGEGSRALIFRVLLPFVCVFWLGRRCEAYHRFRAEEKTPTPGGEENPIKPG